MREVGDKALGRLMNCRVGLTRAFGECTYLDFELPGLLGRTLSGAAKGLGHPLRALLCHWKVREQDADVGACGFGRPIERCAMLLKRGGASAEVGRHGPKPA